MLTTDLAKQIDLLPQDSYRKVENFVEQLLQLNAQTKKDRAFQTFMDKMSVAEKSVVEYGILTEEEGEEVLAKI